jgi:hypothetical protein
LPCIIHLPFPAYAATDNAWVALGGSITVAVANGGAPGIIYEFLAACVYYGFVATSIAELASSIPSAGGGECFRIPPHRILMLTATSSIPLGIDCRWEVRKGVGILHWRVHTPVVYANTDIFVQA